MSHPTFSKSGLLKAAGAEFRVIHSRSTEPLSLNLCQYLIPLNE